jgi:hypothetical protein
MTDSLCFVCHEIPNQFIIYDQVLVCCVDCANKKGLV